MDGLGTVSQGWWVLAIVWVSLVWGMHMRRQCQAWEFYNVKAMIRLWGNLPSAESIWCMFYVAYRNINAHDTWRWVIYRYNMKVSDQPEPTTSCVLPPALFYGPLYYDIQYAPGSWPSLHIISQSIPAFSGHPDLWGPCCCLLYVPFLWYGW